MKPFNLKDAKLGKPVFTRDGRPVEIITFNSSLDTYPIWVCVRGDVDEVYSCTADGKHIPYQESERDLFIEPTKGGGWINIESYGETLKEIEGIYPTKESAESASSPYTIATIYIDWEE